MAKNFTNWHKLKVQLDARHRLLSFNEGEVWWCSIGVNVGVEADGKNTYFERPVLIVRRYNRETFLALPLTSKIKKGTFYYTLSQPKALSAKRLQRRIGKIDHEIFAKIKKAAGIK